MSRPKKISKALADICARSAALTTRIGVAGSRMRMVSERVDDGDLDGAERLLAGLLGHTDVDAIPTEMHALLAQLRGAVEALGG